jgi:hypothetical protein
MQHQNNNQQDFEFISKLPTLKTSSLTDFVNAAAQRLIHYPRISAYYNKDNWSIKLNFKSYIKKQKATHEIAKRFFQDSIKYNKDSPIGEKKQTSTTGKWIPSPPKDKATDSSSKTRLIAYGNASFGTSMKGKLPAPTKRITEAIKKLSNISKGTYFIYVDEYLTSQTCNNCKQNQLKHITTAGSKRKVHAVLKCNSCNTVWNRDVMAAKNILSIFYYMSQHNNERPREFTRPSGTAEVIT